MKNASWPMRAASAPDAARGVDVELEVEGVVCSGVGQGRVFTQLIWVLAQLRRHVDWPVHPGTFNLRLQGPRWTALRRAMDERPGLPIDPPAGFCAAKCFRARVGAPGLAAAVLLPQVDAYPSDQLELIAPVRLRDALGVADGARLPLWVQL